MHYLKQSEPTIYITGNSRYQQYASPETVCINKMHHLKQSVSTVYITVNSQYPHYISLKTAGIKQFIMENS